MQTGRVSGWNDKQETRLLKLFTRRKRQRDEEDASDNDV